MKNDPTSYNAMARVYRTAVAVSALILSSSLAHAADPPVGRGNVSVNVNPVTGYYSTSNTTLRLPNGVSAAPASGASTVTKYSGGLKQSIPTGITINAIKKSAPLPVVVRASTLKLKTAAKGLLRGNVAGLVLGAGLNSFLNGIGALIDDGGNVSRTGVTLASGQRDSYCTVLPRSSFPVYAPDGSIHTIHDKKTASRVACPSNSVTVNNCTNNSIGYYPSSVGYFPQECRTEPNQPLPPLVPVPPNELDDAVDSSYVPEPSDWTNLTPYLQPDDIEITSAPTLQGEPVTKTVYDADGNPHKVTRTNIWYDFDIRDNPSPRPALDMKTREETKTYENGELTGTTTTESTASGGSGGSPESPPESPIDCDLFPTACAWFDWTQAEPTEPDDDLSGLLQEVPIVSETFTITGGVAACPAPMVLDLSVFGSREVSYQPLCDLASTMKYLYLALMSFAAAVLLNRSVNRV